MSAERHAAASARDAQRLSDDPAPELPGLPLQRITPFLERALPGGCGPLVAELIPGGRSNLTFRVSDGAGTWVIRRPPIGEVLASAHDVAREYRVMSALGETAVPVPGVHALCEDTDVIGAPFYVMDFVEGLTYRNAGDLVPLGVARTREISERLIDTLVAVHGVDVAARGLGEFGRPDGFLERQVRLWFQQLEASATPRIDLAGQLRDALASAVPEAGSPGLVHGDFRLDNIIVDAADRPVAVLDWEMATLGDTITDLALLVVYQRTARMLNSDVVPSAATAPGYLDEDAMLDRYCSASGRAVPSWGFHLGLASFKLAGIVAGINARYLNGQIDGPGVSEVGRVVEPLLSAGLDAVRADR